MATSPVFNSSLDDHVPHSGLDTPRMPPGRIVLDFDPVADALPMDPMGEDSDTFPFFAAYSMTDDHRRHLEQALGSSSNDAPDHDLDFDMWLHPINDDDEGNPAQIGNQLPLATAGEIDSVLMTPPFLAQDPDEAGPLDEVSQAEATDVALPPQAVPAQEAAGVAPQAVYIEGPQVQWAFKTSAKHCKCKILVPRFGDVPVPSAPNLDPIPAPDYEFIERNAPEWAKIGRDTSESYKQRKPRRLWSANWEQRLAHARQETLVQGLFHRQKKNNDNWQPECHVPHPVTGQRVELGNIEEPPLVFLEHIAGLDDEIEQEFFDYMMQTFYPWVANGRYGSRDALIDMLARPPHDALSLPEFPPGTPPMPLAGTLLWQALRVGLMDQRAPLCLFKHWRRLGNDGIREFPKIPFETVALVGAEALWIAHVFVEGIPPHLAARPDPVWFMTKYNAIYAYLTALPTPGHTAQLNIHRGLDEAWAFSATGIEVPPPT